jgi:hypothetical protein
VNLKALFREFAWTTRNGNGNYIQYGLHGPLERSNYDLIAALSSTVMKKWFVLSATPSEFGWWLKDRWEDTANSSAKAVGAALDCLLLWPNSMPEKVMAFTKEGPKRVTAKHRADNPDKIVLTFDELQTVIYMSESLRSSKATERGEDFKHCQKHVAVAELFGAPFKCEFDLWTERTEDISDIKTARDVTPAGFGKACAEFGYDVQGIIYLAIANALGFQKKVFNFICVKNSAPYTVKVYRFRPYENPKHREVMDSCMERLNFETAQVLDAARHHFRDDDRWEDLSIPEWAVRRHERALAA